jgi:hypothetical protein
MSTSSSPTESKRNAFRRGLQKETATKHNCMTTNTWLSRMIGPWAQMAMAYWTFRPRVIYVQCSQKPAFELPHFLRSFLETHCILPGCSFGSNSANLELWKILHFSSLNGLLNFSHIVLLMKKNLVRNFLKNFKITVWIVLQTTDVNISVFPDEMLHNTHIQSDFPKLCKDLSIWPWAFLGTFPADDSEEQIGFSKHMKLAIVHGNELDKATYIILDHRNIMISSNFWFRLLRICLDFHEITMKDLI